jgi:hypothetical protein
MEEQRYTSSLNESGGELLTNGPRRSDAVGAQAPGELVYQHVCFLGDMMA